VTLIEEMAGNNRLWGAERIRGELLLLDIHVCLPHHPEVREICAPGLATRTEVEHLLTYSCRAGLGLRRVSRSLTFSSARLQAFFIVEVHSRRVIHIGVTRYPTDA
jgi:hypothetical protein